MAFAGALVSTCLAPALGIRSHNFSAKSWARSCKSAKPMSAKCALARRHGLESHSHLRPTNAKNEITIEATTGPIHRETHRPARHLVRNHLCHADPARRPTCAPKRMTAAAMLTMRALYATNLRCQVDVAARSLCGCAATRGHPARTGRERPNRMAAAFHAAGFEPVDVHMSDILAGRINLLPSGRRGLRRVFLR